MFQLQLIVWWIRSSLLTVIMNNVYEIKQHFSASFDDKNYDENKFAQLISNQIESNHLI